MIKVQVGELEKISIEQQKEGYFLDGLAFDGEIVKIDESSYKIYKSNKIFRVEVVKRNGKEMKLKINDLLLDVSVTNHIDQILDKLGMNIATSAVVKDVKAPMPGSILNITVSKGDEVNQGDQLLVLEAMKMENVIKSPRDGTISKIFVSKKENIEKNQVLISFE